MRVKQGLQSLLGQLVMVVRIIMCLGLIGVGAFALYIVSTKPQHDFSKAPLDQALGIPQAMTRIIRGAFGVLAIIMGIVGILRTLGWLP